MRPPHIREVVESVGKMAESQFGFVNINLDQFIEEEVNKKTELGKFIEEAMRRGQALPTDILTSMV